MTIARRRFFKTAVALAAALYCSQALAAIAVVRNHGRIDSNNNGSATSRSITLANAVVAGSDCFIIVQNYANNASDPPTSITVNGTAATLQNVVYGGGNLNSSQIWLAKNCASGTNVTLNYTTAHSSWITGVDMLECSGIGTLDKAPAGGSGASTTPTCTTTGTLASANQIVICSYVDIDDADEGTITAPTNYTTIGAAATALKGGASAYRIVSATTAQAPAWSNTGSTGWRSTIATFTEASGAAAPKQMTTTGAG